MDRNKARHIVTTTMKNAWPKWNMTWEQQDRWTNMLCHYTEEHANQAIDQMFEEGKSSVQPFPNEFVRYIKAIRESSTRRVAENYPERQATLWAICIEEGKRLAFPGLKVWFPEGTPVADAQQWVRDTEAGLAGGRWVVFEGRLWEAQQKAKQIKADAGSESRLSEQVASESEGEPAQIMQGFDPNKLMPDKRDNIPF